MMALLRLIPLKDWLYIGLLATLLTGFLWFRHHERAIGAERCEARVEKAQAEAQAKISAQAQQDNADALKRYQALDEALAHAPAKLNLPSVCVLPKDAVDMINRAHKRQP